MISLELLFQITFIVVIEMSFLVFAYRKFISRWNFEVWKSKITSDEDTTFQEILEPIIVQISEDVASDVIGALEHKYRQNLGTLSRSASAPSNQSELTQGMVMAESILKSMGMKSPSIALIGQLLTSLSGLTGESEDSTQERLF